MVTARLTSWLDAVAFPAVQRLLVHRPNSHEVHLRAVVARQTKDFQAMYERARKAEKQLAALRPHASALVDPSAQQPDVEAATEYVRAWLDGGEVAAP